MFPGGFRDPALLVGSFKVDPVTMRRPLSDHSLPGVENVRKHVDILNIPFNVRCVEHSIKTMIVCCGVLSEELLVKALVPGVLEHKVQLSQVVAVGVDVEVIHCEARDVEHPKLFSKLFGELGLVECRRSLDHHQLAVVLEPLSSAVNQRQRIAESVKFS